MPEPASIPIEDIAFGGKGVGRLEGKAVFIPFTIPGETAAVQIVKEKKKYAEGRVVNLEHSSPDRVQPPCPYFGQCGGCSYQHISYPRQLDIKTRQVEQTLHRVGHFPQVPMRPIVASPLEYEYRNRIRVHATDGAVGFYAMERHELIDIECCPIASAEVNAQLRALRQRPVRDGDYTLTEHGHAEYFAQTNDAVAAALVRVVQALPQAGQTTLIDAYCGAGLFAKQLLHLFNNVIGIEENERAVSQARLSAQPNESYLAGDVGVHLGEVLTAHERAKTTLLLDPPALGIEARVIDAILASPPGEIIYVSCNPATLARDLAMLFPVYALQSVTPLDMFPQTAEIEAVAHLTLQ